MATITTGQSFLTLQSYDWKEPLSHEESVASSAIIAGLKKVLCSILFSKLFYNLEAAGLGQVYITDPKQTIVTKYAAKAGLSGSEELFTQILNSSLRIWGDLYRYDASEWHSMIGQVMNTHEPALKITYKEVSSLHKLDPSTVGPQVFLP